MQTNCLKYTTALFLASLMHIAAFGQQGIKGCIRDRREPLISAIVRVYQNGVYKEGAATDYDGNYIIKPLDAGRYRISATMDGYDSIAADVAVFSDSFSVFNGMLTEKPTLFDYRVKCNIGRLSHMYVYGKVMDENGGELPGATIWLYKDGQLNQTDKADSNAAYRFHCSEARIINGKYQLRSFYPGYDTTIIDFYFKEKEQKEDLQLKRLR